MTPCTGLASEAQEQPAGCGEEGGDEMGELMVGCGRYGSWGVYPICMTYLRMFGL